MPKVIIRGVSYKARNINRILSDIQPGLRYDEYGLRAVNLSFNYLPKSYKFEDHIKYTLMTIGRFKYMYRGFNKNINNTNTLSYILKRFLNTKKERYRLWG